MAAEERKEEEREEEREEEATPRRGVMRTNWEEVGCDMHGYEKVEA